MENLNNHLRRNATVIIMNKNDSNGTRDFVMIDHENATFYPGSTHSMSFDVRSCNHMIDVSRKKEIKREIEKLTNRGYKKEYLDTINE